MDYVVYYDRPLTYGEHALDIHSMDASLWAAFAGHEGEIKKET